MYNNRYSTLVEATNALMERGFTEQFQVNEDGRMAGTDKDAKSYAPEKLTVVEYHRFEGESAPEDMSVIYAIETDDGTKGTLIDAYGTYASAEAAEFIKKLKIEEDPA
ncbi:hypothetical protein SAMN05421823_110231 [Catalinimonas alkaloidigena]|uniref:Phosphoribosylpyrophosphate synthetase n=1 Tax=Catalinimonas alkaloidigena TaxID=1075417 RepID=A0A1G9QNX0_9BACT|nr:phosphoribosylpyrophosphate synthetase [Catalinimonas alkaloidigena]SDM12277.1 hypothetical protein SAMN05421823_110231 [Catalinimonas alkaloidigena]